MIDRQKLNDLKIFAAKYCVEIFEMFDELEIYEQRAPIRNAWHTGRKIRALVAE